jgi:hypothetical protein
MKNCISIALFFVSIRGFAGTQQSVTAFLNTFPEKMSCIGVEVNHMTQLRKPLTQNITIQINGKLSAAPIIEVNAPNSDRGHFRIGDGYGGRMEKMGTFSYEIIDTEHGKTLFYVRRAAGDESEFDTEMYMRLRDAGGLISFSGNRVCRTTYHCFELSNCITVPKI